MTAEGAQLYGGTHSARLGRATDPSVTSLINPLEASVFRLTRATISLGLATALVLTAAQAALAGTELEDTSALVPPPPPYAVCQLNGPWATCRSEVTFELVNEPAFELSCGTVYQTSTDVRTVTRWYADNKLETRHVHQRAEGVWSLSSTGDAPTVTYRASANWGEVYSVPGDLSSAKGHQRGTDLLAKSANGGVVAHISGQTHLDRFGVEQFDGRFSWIDGPVDAAVAASVDGALCEALGA